MCDYWSFFRQTFLMKSIRLYIKLYKIIKFRLMFEKIYLLMLLLHIALLFGYILNTENIDILKVW